MLNKERGIALVEVIVASALLGIILYAGFKMMSLPDIMRGNARQQVNNLEKSKEMRNRMLDIVLPKINIHVDYDKIIKLDKNIFSSNIRKRKSFMTAISYIDYKYISKLILMPLY